MGSGRQFSVREATGKTSTQETEKNLEETWDKERKSPAGMGASSEISLIDKPISKATVIGHLEKHKDRERDTALKKRVFDLSKLRTRLFCLQYKII